MDANERIPQAGTALVMHTVLSMLLIAIAVALLIYMITLEGEPGALPLLLLASGIAWLPVARLRMRPRHG